MLSEGGRDGGVFGEVGKWRVDVLALSCNPLALFFLNLFFLICNKISDLDFLGACLRARVAFITL